MPTAEINSFVFYRSFFEGLEGLSPGDQYFLLRAVVEYGLNRTFPEFPDTERAPYLRMIWNNIKPSLDSNYQRRLNGLKGGPPKGTRNNPNGRRGKNKSRTNQELTENKPYEDVYEEKYEDEEGRDISTSLSFPYSSAAFMDTWNALRNQPKWRKKSTRALQMSLNKLADYEEQFAILLMNDAIEHDWTGVVFGNTPQKYHEWKRMTPENEPIISTIEEAYR